jgi:hypothetical protein
MFTKDIVTILLCNYKDAIILAQTCREYLKLATDPYCLIRMVQLYSAAASGIITNNNRVTNSINTTNNRVTNSINTTNSNKNMDVLPSFFYASIPCNLINLPYKYPFANIHSITNNTKLNLANCCVTSGEMLRDIYEIGFILLFGIWTSPNNKNNLMLTKESKGWESCVIARNLLPYQYISTFDFSVMQHGIVYDNTGNAILHITPLSLYTYYTKDIIITPKPMNNNIGIMQDINNVDYVYYIASLRLRALSKLKNSEKYYINNSNYQSYLHGAFASLETGELNSHISSAIDKWCFDAMKTGYKFSYVKLADSTKLYYVDKNVNSDWCNTQ